ncbi:MAG: glutamyl-tRNA reductase [Micromonosporaceae bacterium]|nr:glutamyl-tRNA reductase [Micromonosporaceae bacterium]
MNLLVVGASYRTADVALLERLSVAPAVRTEVLRALLRREHVTEAVLLSTCNRVEVYAGVSTFHGGVAELSAALADRAGVDPAVLAGHLYVHWDADAVRHALRVTAGLDSMVAGEAQILGQVREAYAVAAAADATGRLLHDLMQQALRVGKRAHAETGIDAAGRSVVTAALAAAVESIMEFPRRVAGVSLQQLHDRQGEPAGAADLTGRDAALAGRSAMVIGAGSMGALALATLARAGVGPLFVANRDADRAHRLAASHQAQAVPLTGLGDAMSTVDVVVSATASVGPVLSRNTVAAVLAARAADRGPLVICDLAVPRDVEPAAADLPGVVLIDLERLASRVPAGATREVAAAEEIVAAEAATVAHTLRDSEVAPTVAALRARADEVVSAELDRLAQRRPDLTNEQRAEVAHAVHRLVQRLLHQPTVRVRQLATEPGGRTYAAVLAELFDLQVPQPRRADEVPDLVARRNASDYAGGPSDGEGAAA